MSESVMSEFPAINFEPVTRYHLALCESRGHVPWVHPDHVSSDLALCKRCGAEVPVTPGR